MLSFIRFDSFLQVFAIPTRSTCTGTLYGKARRGNLKMNKMYCLPIFKARRLAF